jgi:hypothetical protein
MIASTSLGFTHRKPYLPSKKKENSVSGHLMFGDNAKTWIALAITFHNYDHTDTTNVTLGHHPAYLTTHTKRK